MDTRGSKREVAAGDYNKNDLYKCTFSKLKKLFKRKE